MGHIPTSGYFAEITAGAKDGGLWWAGMQPEGADGKLQDALNLEEIVGAPKTSDEVIKLAGLDWEVAKEPVFIHGAPRPVYRKVIAIDTETNAVIGRAEDVPEDLQAIRELPGYQERVEGVDGKTFTVGELPVEGAFTQPFIEVPKHRAIYRTDRGICLGMVTDDFEPVQNRKGFEVADLLAGEGEILYEGALALWDGALVCLLARRPEPMKILGDEFTNYFLFYNWHNGAGAVGGCYTDVRVVCQNTYQAAVDNSERQFKLRHSTNVVERLKLKAQVLLQNEKYTRKVGKEAEELAAIPVSEQRWEAIVNMLIPIPVDASEQTIKSRETQRFGLQQTILMPDLENFRWTGWGAVQAVSAFINHSMPLRKQKNWAQNRFHNNWIRGNDMLQQAIIIVRSFAE